MHGFGGSVVVGIAGDILKIHVHTDAPDAVFTYAEQWGTVTARKAEDMRAQHRRLSHVETRRVAIVVDSSNDLPDAVLDQHRIIMVPLQVMFGHETFRDRIELKPEDFYRRLRNGQGVADDLPTHPRPVCPGVPGGAGRGGGSGRGLSRRGALRHARLGAGGG
ncbi:MAG: DegV family protein [Gemmatimonadetes bacterium]|nr:DegV family protein [Gemmatimonadota bacterium]